MDNLRQRKAKHKMNPLSKTDIKLENFTSDSKNFTIDENSEEEFNCNDKTLLIQSQPNTKQPNISDDENFKPHHHQGRHSITRSESNNPEEESAFIIARQVCLPYIMAAMGLVAAGLLLDVIQHWKVYQDINELYVLIPSLLGLKGNLEMTLASRVSTAANNGKLDTKEDRKSIILGNMSLIQCQAAMVALIAALIAMIMSWISTGSFILAHAMIMCSAALYTAAIASALLSSLMMFIIIKSHEWGIDPDNVATPIAASLGDLITLGLLSGISSFLYWAKDTGYKWCIPLSLTPATF